MAKMNLAKGAEDTGLEFSNTALAAACKSL